LEGREEPREIKLLEKAESEVTERGKKKLFNFLPLFYSLSLRYPYLSSSSLASSELILLLLLILLSYN